MYVYTVRLRGVPCMGVCVGGGQIQDTDLALVTDQSNQLGICWLMSVSG